ncbi:DUF2007 domain-containing protein [Rivibacter subsaxonicus]|uniref:Signal transducing protein n=1 Tax=Rivibacter subsaxonicus TaxID=457575 RepID=A0A4Q7W153_9BURK|nr:DUF2007 domain-containing protein [Rivibacter subsaxonicus]RZU02743.1 hypothetical protein EV670_0772 [Rivibacter subsaxonicus]
MQRLQIAPNLALATLWADWLSQSGFPASVQRANAVALAGSIPPDEALPEVWIEGEADQLDAARALLALLTAGPSRRWCCRGCGEQIDGPFEQCWNCGAAMPA